MGRIGSRLALTACLLTCAGCLGGRSLGGSGGTGLGGASGGEGGGGDLSIGSDAGGAGCGAEQDVRLARLPPDVLVVMDRSSSMGDDSFGMTCTGGCGPTSKWSLLSAAVQSLTAQNPDVDWGLVLYGSDDSCGTAVAPLVPVGAGHAPAIAAALASATLGGEAPTAGAITSAAAALQALTDGHPKYILLVTDGRSGCAQDADTATALAESSLGTAFDQSGIPTFVLGPAPASDAAAVAVLDQMAIRGGRPQPTPGHAYDTPADVEVAFQPISSGLECVLPLQDPPVSLTDVGVSLTLSNGALVAVPQDPLNGWMYTDTSMSAVVLSGTSCGEIMDGTVTDIRIVYACSGPGPDIGLR